MCPTSTERAGRPSPHGAITLQTAACRSQIRGVGLTWESLTVAGCTASKAFRMGDEATKAGDFDQAVAYHRTAVQSAPDNPNYRSLFSARCWRRRACTSTRPQFENHQLVAARSEYKLTSEHDRRRLRERDGRHARSVDRNRVEASRPRPLDQLREQARAAAPLPLLNPTTDRVSLDSTGTRVGDVLNTIANASGINVTFDAQANINGPITIHDRRPQRRAGAE